MSRNFLNNIYSPGGGVSPPADNTRTYAYAKETRRRKRGYTEAQIVAILQDSTAVDPQLS